MICFGAEHDEANYNCNCNNFPVYRPMYQGLGQRLGNSPTATTSLASDIALERQSGPPRRLEPRPPLRRSRRLQGQDPERFDAPADGETTYYESPEDTEAILAEPETTEEDKSETSSVRKADEAYNEQLLLTDFSDVAIHQILKDIMDQNERLSNILCLATSLHNRLPDNKHTLPMT